MAETRLTAKDEAIIRMAWPAEQSWPVPQLLAEIDRLREAVETEWYNGNVDEGARDRILRGWKPSTPPEGRGG